MRPQIVWQPSHLMPVHWEGKSSVAGSRVLDVSCLTAFTWWLHHAGPKLRHDVHRVAFRTAQLVDVHAGRCAYIAVVADEKVKILETKKGRNPSKFHIQTHTHRFFFIYFVCFYLTNWAAVWEAWLGQSDHVSRWIIADHVEVVLQRSVSGALEVDQLHRLVHPDLPEDDERTQWQEVESV